MTSKLRTHIIRVALLFAVAALVVPVSRYPVTSAHNGAPNYKEEMEPGFGQKQERRAQTETEIRNNAVKDSPPDTTDYQRPAVSEDYAPRGKRPLPMAFSPYVFVRDVVVSNTNAGLKNTDNFNDGEPSIAINPQNPDEIVLEAFSGGWGANAPLWHSTDGGSTWSKLFTLPIPPGDGSAPGCPCDQNPDYGRANNMSSTFLTANIFSGTTTNPASAAAFNYFLSGGNAVRTNSVGVNNVDQPWLLVNRDNAIAAQDNVFVGYDDFSGAPNMRVAVALGTNPPNFVRDNQSGVSGGGFVNPGHRLAVDPRNGWVYSLFQQRTGGTANAHAINYMLNRSIDGGVTWTLNGSIPGIVVVNANSTQGFAPSTTFDGSGNCTSDNAFKFGTVNALFGGVEHATVDPNNGDVYYVYGNRDGGTGNNRLSIIRLTDNGGGGLTIGAPHFVTGQVQAALPSVAVNANGVIGVLYTQFDGLSGGGIPMFSAHLAMSEDHGVTFTDTVLENFLSSANNNGACKQRVLGDYQQVKAVGNTFYGVFTGNGIPFGRPFANHDPIFFKVQPVCSFAAPANVTAVAPPGQCNATVNYTTPTSPAECGPITCTPASGSVFPVGTTTVTCTMASTTTLTGGPSANFTVTVNDTQLPSIVCPGNIAKFTDSGQFTAIVNPGVPVTSDNCSLVTTAGVRSDGKPLNAPYPIGVTNIVWTTRDAGGNTASCGEAIAVMVPSGQRRLP